jgi:hypothetical protein
MTWKHEVHFLSWLHRFSIKDATVLTFDFEEQQSSSFYSDQLYQVVWPWSLVLIPPTRFSYQVILRHFTISLDDDQLLNDPKWYS